MADFKTTTDKLKTRGYWRVEFYPSTFTSSAISTLADCKMVITESKVQLRGWDYPHVPVDGDEKQGIYAKDGNHYESWIDWNVFKEVWRFYKSGKFIHLFGLHEHWYDEYETFLAPNPLSNLTPGTVVDIINAIYELTEISIFLYNLADHLQGVESFELKISLNNVENNKLALLDNSRVPIHGNYVSHTADITALQVTLTKNELLDKEKMLTLARTAAQAVFENFEWQASETLLEEEQKKLLSRRF